MQISINELYLVADAVYSGSTQEMDVAQAERVADFFEQFASKIEETEPRRQELLKRQAAQEEWDKFLEEKVELPDFNFKEFNTLRWKPGQLRLLKKVGLFK
jgi:hypothetical protein